MSNANYSRKNGLRAGYGEYRYGTKPKKLDPVYRGEARRHVVNLVMDALRDWRLSKFENEGPVRAGIRAALCVRGYPWDRADFEAANLINSAFAHLGYARPVWDEGQREYSVPSENCKWCGVEIPEDMFREGANYRFCSDVCARSALQYRDFKARHHSDAAYSAAWSAISRGKNEPKACLECGKQFRPFKPGAQYCSRECTFKAAEVLPRRDCPHCHKQFRPSSHRTIFCSEPCARASKRLPTQLCRQCGIAFQPHTLREGREHVFCSVSCKKAHGLTVKYDLTCQWCHAAFRSSLPYSKYCSASCKNQASRVISGKQIPKRISPPVFDYFFKQAA